MEGPFFTRSEILSLLKVYIGMHDDVQVLNATIENLRLLSSLFRRPHPFRPSVIARLGLALLNRYLIFHQEDDLIATIHLLTEVLLLPLCPEADRFFTTISIFYKLVCSLALRFDLYHDSQDLEQAVRYYRHILTLPPGDIDSLEALHSLTTMLAHKVRLGAEVELDLAEEVVQIFRTSVARDPSSGHVGPTAARIGDILMPLVAQSNQSGESEQVLSLFGRVEELCSPERSPEFYVDQGFAFGTYFHQTNLYDHHEQAMVRFNKALAVLSPKHRLRSFIQISIAILLQIRSRHDKELESVEEAIRHCRAVLADSPQGDPLRPSCLAVLSRLLSQRYTLSGNVGSLQEAEACIHDMRREEIPENVGPILNMMESHLSIQNFQRNNSMEALEEEIRFRQERFEKTPVNHSDRFKALKSLSVAYRARFRLTNKLVDLEQEISYLSIALALSPPNHSARYMTLINLSNACLAHHTLDRTEMRYLDFSIAYSTDALKLSPLGHISRFKPLLNLAASLSLHFLALRQRADLDESMALFRSAFEECAYPRMRYEIAGMWATYARVCQHPSTMLAYEKAISLIQSSFAVGPTLEVQHHILRGRWEFLSVIPLRCASYYIEMGSLKPAVEVLECGRALLWSEMRGFRAPIDELRASGHAMLAEQFVAVSKELENVAMSTQAPEIDVKARGSATLHDDHDHSRPDVFSQMIEHVRVLEHKRGEVVDQIRLVPGFAHFRKALPFGTLQTAAACGPVIMINHCVHRSDIIIVLHDSAPVLIPTAEDFYTRTAKLKELLLETRTKFSLDSIDHERALCFVLQELYKLVGRPVIEKFRELGIPKQSRVWWCPTSVFCSLPLHAAGPIESEDSEKQYFSDLYVSSYTPSLSALIESRKGMVENYGPPSVLIVGQPDPSLRGVRGEIQAVRRHAPSVLNLIGAKATRARVMKHLADHRIVHFACHGRLEPERPFETGFVLHDDERLTLLDIVRSQLSTAECAFLSVCHAAEWTDEDTAEEALHLAAAMQYCGFRSVVGTLWAMADIDGRDLAGHFYGFMFGEGAEERGIGIGERSARALRDSVQMLRRKRGITLERWVNFVHYGG